MKIEKISENIIKVTISLNDLEERNIDKNILNYNSDAAQELLWDMMEQAEIEFGFDISDSQLIIEPTSGAEDEVIITITRMDEDGDFESIHQYIKSRFKKSELKSKKASNKISYNRAIYSFSNFDDLAVLCKQIASLYSGDSSVFKCRDSYYLLLTKNNHTINNPNLFDSILSEYSDKVVNANFYDGYLSEYGEKIVESNAVQTIIDYF